MLMQSIVVLQIEDQEEYLTGTCTPGLMRRRLTQVPCAEFASYRYAAFLSPLYCSTACRRELDGCSSTMSAQHELGFCLCVE